jgi:hypothetical protein
MMNHAYPSVKSAIWASYEVTAAQSIGSYVTVKSSY